MRFTKILLLLITLMTSCQGKKSEMSILFTGDVILDRGVQDQMRLHGDSLLENAL